MGKTYLDTVKYMIRASIEVAGIVEKPDLVGAVFGQTEGLLGDDLDLRELQKNGRIGRIEVDLRSRQGRSEGTLLVPSSLDMVETSILAAALEIVDRVGPCEARISVNRIEDIRNVKRKKVLDRARLLLRSLLTEEIPESKELTELVREDVKVEEITAYGPEKLPCGPEVASASEIIFVEGRADVVNLLRNNINNAIAIGGANVGATIAKLGKEKEVTVFLDGDRGGDIILKELLAATDIDFVARAPAGKEVEELTRKELIKCLRRRMPVEQAESGGGYPRAARGGEEEQTNAYDRSKHMQYAAQAERTAAFRARFSEQQPEGSADASDATASAAAGPEADAQTDSAVEQKPAIEQPAETVEVATVRASLKELEGSLKARLLDDKLEPLAEIPIREIMRSLSDAAKVRAVILDGIITQRLIDLAEQKGAEFVVGVRTGNISRKPQNISIVLSAA
jgi:DNA primase